MTSTKSAFCRLELLWERLIYSSDKMLSEETMGETQVKEIRRAYGFDEVSIAPGVVTVNPEMTNIEFSIDGLTLGVPVLASAMDAIVSPSFACEMDRLG